MTKAEAGGSLDKFQGLCNAKQHKDLRRKVDSNVGIRERLVDDMKAAMRQKAVLRLGTIRMIRAEVQTKDKETGTEASEQEIVRILQSMVKKRQEAAVQYTQGNRDDLAQKEIEEIGIVQGYLPAQLSDEELTNLARSIIADVGAASMKDMGKVMGRLTKELEGRAASARVSQTVKELLQPS